MDVTGAINKIQDIWLNISGIRAAPDTPPEGLIIFPIAITYERSGEMFPNEPHSGNFSQQNGVIWSELHLARKDLPRDVAQALTFRNAFLDGLRDDPDLTDSVMIITRVAWTSETMQWAGIDTIGYRFEVEFGLEL